MLEALEVGRVQVVVGEEAEEVSTHEVRFVPFSLEVGGAWGPAAKRFFNTCVKLAGDDRDIDLYHWSSERFSSAWMMDQHDFGFARQRSGTRQCSGRGDRLA